MRRLLAGALVAAVVVSGCGKEEGNAPPPPAGKPANVPDFDAQQAFALLKQQVAFGPRVPGTPGHQKQLDWMTDYLKQRADTVELRSFDVKAPNGDSLHLTNVFARFNPQAHDRILLVAHWDTRPTSDSEADSTRRKLPISGANDGGSGVAVLMQLADVLKRHSAPIGVDLLFVDGEDYTGDMYLGSEHFAANLPPGYSPLYGILVDMVGDQSPLFPVEPNSQQAAPEVVDRVWRTAEQIGYGPYFPRSQGMAIDDDHIPLNRAGIRTIDIIDFDYGPNNAYWHTQLDTVEHTSPVGLGVVGNVIATLIYTGG